MKTNKEIYEIKKTFQKEGFVIINNVFPKKKIKLVKKRLFDFLKKKKASLGKRKIHFANNSKLINSVHHLNWGYVKKVRRNKKIVNIVKVLLNEKIKDFGAEVFAKPAKVGMRVPIHQDNFYWNLDKAKGLTVWIALDKCRKKNGAIFYYRNSQKLGLLDHRSSYAPGSSQVLKDKKILKKFKKVTPELDPGDILIHDCLIIHGSNKNISKKDRTGLTMRYIAKSSKINKAAKHKYEKALKKQINYFKCQDTN